MIKSIGKFDKSRHGSLQINIIYFQTAYTLITSWPTANMDRFHDNINKWLPRWKTMGQIERMLCYILLAWPLASIPAEIENDRFAERSVRIGFNFQAYRDFDRPNIEIALKYLCEEIGKKTNIPTLISFYEDFDVMRKDFESGRINLISTTPWAITQYFKNELLADAVRTSMDDVSFDRLMLLTRRDQGITAFNDLQNKTLGLVDKDNFTKMYLDSLLLKHLSKHYQKVFKNITYFKNSQQLILGLFFKKVDAIVTFSSIYDIAGQLNPQINDSIQIVDSMPGVFWGTMYFHKNVDPAFREYIINVLLALKEDVQGKQLLELLKGTQFVRSRLTDLNAINALNSEYKQLLEKYK